MTAYASNSLFSANIITFLVKMDLEEISPSCKKQMQNHHIYCEVRSIGLTFANTTHEIRLQCPIILNTRKCNVPKTVLKYKPEAPQKQGRPRKRWSDLWGCNWHQCLCHKEKKITLQMSGEQTFQVEKVLKTI